MPHVCVVGAGYVGLVTAACLAETGTHVICLERHPERVALIQAGKPWFFEPGLSEILRDAVTGGRLQATADAAGAIASADTIITCVGTPPGPDGQADLSGVFGVVDEVARSARPGAVLVLKSTVPVGTNRRAAERLTEAGRADIAVISNPEFLREGRAVDDFLRPERIVVGSRPEADHARKRMAALYQPLTLDVPRILWMDPESAELAKYANNTMLATRISLMNELARVCDATGADIHAVRRAIGADGRIGSKYIYAGPGYGGACLPKDVDALIATGTELGLPMTLARAVRAVNEAQADVIRAKIAGAIGKPLSHCRIAIWGLAFKPRTDDVRNSPSIALAHHLVAAGATVVAHDPQAARTAVESLPPEVVQVQSEYEAARGADALVLMTEWRQYQNPDFDRLIDTMATPVIVDARNIWSELSLSTRGFRYAAIGARER